ncbi:hypothetical protein [Cellulosimicrobium composti]|uniref:hypothetical protein n=1 Tax=Cellulosimicrobium composti TaxID=2672572 RepID=UPI0018AC944C|nr:hypothetical protein [Cellulosimicrobium composti]
MGRPRTPIGAYGGEYFVDTPSGKVQARVRYREQDGRVRTIKTTGRTRAEALRLLKRKIANNETVRAGGEEDLTADSPFGDLVDAWLESLDDAGKLAASTRYRYERDMRTLVLPAFEHLALREISVRRVDKLLKQLRKRSYDRAQKAKVVLNLAFKLAVRWECPASSCWQVLGLGKVGGQRVGQAQVDLQGPVPGDRLVRSHGVNRHGFSAASL